MPTLILEDEHRCAISIHEMIGLGFGNVVRIKQARLVSLKSWVMVLKYERRCSGRICAISAVW